MLAVYGQFLMAVDKRARQRRQDLRERRGPGRPGRHRFRVFPRLFDLNHRNHAGFTPFHPPSGCDAPSHPAASNPTLPHIPPLPARRFLTSRRGVRGSSLVSVLPELEALARKMQEMRERAGRNRGSVHARAGRSCGSVTSGPAGPEGACTPEAAGPEGACTPGAAGCEGACTPGGGGMCGRVWWLKSEGPDGGVGALL